MLKNEYKEVENNRVVLNHCFNVVKSKNRKTFCKQIDAVHSLTLKIVISLVYYSSEQFGLFTAIAPLTVQCTRENGYLDTCAKNNFQGNKRYNSRIICYEIGGEILFILKNKMQLDLLLQ